MASCSPAHASSVGPVGIHRDAGGAGGRFSEPSECSAQRSTDWRKVLVVDDGGLGGGLVGVGPSSLSLLPWSVEPPLDHSAGPFLGEMAQSSADEALAAARAAAALAPAPTAACVAFAAGLRATAAFFLGTPEAFPPLTLAAAPLP